MNLSKNKRHSLDRTKPTYQIAASRMFASAINGAYRSRGDDCESLTSRNEKGSSILRKESKEESADLDSFKAGIPRYSSKVNALSQISSDYDDSSEDEDKKEDIYSKFDSTEETAVLENSSEIIKEKEDFDYRLPIRGENDSALLNSGSIYMRKSPSTDSDNYKLPIQSNSTFSPLPASLHTYVSSSESCIIQTNSVIETESDYCKYFRNKNSNDKLNRASPVTPCHDKEHFIIPSPVDHRETQRIPSLSESDKNYLDTSYSGYPSNGSPANSSMLELKNRGTTTIFTNQQFLKRSETPPSSRPTTPLLPTVNLHRDRPKDSPSPSMKRSFSYMSDNSPNIFYSPTDRNSRRSLDLSVEKREFISCHRRTASELPSPVTSLSNRFSMYDINRTPQQSNSRCIADQSPYSPKESPKFGSKRMRTESFYYDASELQEFQSKFGFIDSHCHLDFLFQRDNFTGTYTDYQAKNKDSFPQSYKGCVAVFCNPFTFSKLSLWSEILKEDNVWAAFGCHPHNSKDYNEEIEEALLAALKHPRVRALGEIGLDYSNRNNCPKETQIRVFKRQLVIALKMKFPLVIHCREAHEDCFRIMKQSVPIEHHIHLHCFTNEWDLASRWLDTFPNLFIGLTNLVTYQSAESVHEVARKIPLHRLLLETDTPYFVPRPVKFGGETRLSHPGMAIHVAAQVAALKNETLETVFESTIANTRKMYGIE